MIYCTAPSLKRPCLRELARLTRCIVWFSAQRPVHAAALDTSIALPHRPALKFLCAGPKRVAGGCVGARRPEALTDDFPQHRDVDGACPANSFTEKEPTCEIWRV